MVGSAGWVVAAPKGAGIAVSRVGRTVVVDAAETVAWWLLCIQIPSPQLCPQQSSTATTARILNGKSCCLLCSGLRRWVVRLVRCGRSLRLRCGSWLGGRLLPSRVGDPCVNKYYCRRYNRDNDKSRRYNRSDPYHRVQAYALHFYLLSLGFGGGG